MKSHSLFRVLNPIVLVLALAASETKAQVNPGNQSSVPKGGVPIGNMIGYDSLNQKIRDRIFSANSGFRLDYFLNDNFDSPASLSKLLGFFGSSGTFQYGSPGPLNLLLTKAVIWTMAMDISRVCLHERPKFALRMTIEEVATQLCQTPDLSTTDVLLDRLWEMVVMLDAPEAQKMRWKEVFKARPQNENADGQGLRDMLFTAIVNPYFLLEQ